MFAALLLASYRDYRIPSSIRVKACALAVRNSTLRVKKKYQEERKKKRQRVIECYNLEINIEIFVTSFIICIDCGLS